MRNEVADAPREINEFSLTLYFKLNFVISRDRVIYSRSEFEQRLYDLTGQHKTDPYAEQEGESRNNTEHPFSPVDKLPSPLTIIFDAGPASHFEIRQNVQHVLTGYLQI